MKSKIIICLSLLLLLSDCSSKKDLISNTPANETKVRNTFVFIPNGLSVNSYSVIEKNIEYTVGVLKNKIIYIGTTDKNFTISGLKIGDKLPETYFSKEWGYRPGWGYYIEIESGWFAGFDFQTEPNYESRIQWFFKYDFDN